MQLSTIKISNLLSFPYVENLTAIEGVKFHNSESGVINIIIWPNGSGKSNLLDIINAVRKYSISTNYAIVSDETGDRIVIKKNPPHHLHKHRLTPQETSHVYMSILLHQYDFDNLTFVSQHSEEINTLIEKYSDSPVRFWSVDMRSLLFYNKVPLYCHIDTDHESISLHRHKIDNSLEFIYNYLQHFELIQHCITLYNRQRESMQTFSHNRLSNDIWYPLRNTFALIGSQSRTREWTTSSLPKPLRFCLKKYQIYRMKEGKGEWEGKGNAEGFLSSINETLNRYVSLHMSIDNVEANKECSIQNIYFEDRDGYRMTFYDLSSGEQSFVSIILLLYGHDLYNGMMIIDEPEIHLHPQSQELFITLLEEMKTKQKMQFIIATHAPSMINEHNINHVFRCHKKHSITSITTPANSIDQDEASLLQILKFEYIAKIFFVDRIIMVEGETDMYFLNYYLNYLKWQPERQWRIDNYEIITIGGKGWFKRRKHFLTRFSIQASYVCDWDNIIEYGIINTLSPHLHGQRKLKHKPQFGGSKYASMVWKMKSQQPAKYQMIKKRIQQLYEDDVYIMMEGDLEAYLWLPAKGLDDTIYFCQNNFVNWLADSNFASKREELNTIIGRIFSDNTLL